MQDSSRNKMEADNSVEGEFVDVPDCFLWEVLIRLPLKFVVRCKLVSKRWASLISDPLFVRSYRSHYSPSSSWTVIGQQMVNHGGNNLTFLEYDLPDAMRSRKYSFGSLRLPNVIVGESYKVFGASNGLILFGLINLDGNCYVVPNIYYICNPATGESIRLPSLTARKFTTNNHRHWGPALIARVENDVLESYRVVLLLPYKEVEYLRVSVCASETLEWKEFILPCEVRYQYIFNAPTTLNNQIVHWSTSYGTIIAYDPYANSDHLRVIAPPPRYPRPGSFVFYSKMCSASSGRLRHFETFTIKDHLDNVQLVLFKLWVLEDYNSGTWSLLHEADDMSVLFDGSVAARELIKDLHPMFFDPSDADVLYLSDSRRLVSYDFKTSKVEVVDEHNQFIRSRFDFFLVKPSPWPVSISNGPCSSSATSNDLLMRGFRSLCEKFYDYFLSSN